MEKDHPMEAVHYRATGDASTQWRRVFILGGPGSGKSTLGRRLAQALACPLFNLDAVGYEGGAGPERSRDARLLDVATIAVKDRWVAEGSFIDWTEALAEAADRIVVLDPPCKVARHRIVMRHVKASLRRSNQHAGLRNLWRFVRDSERYYTGRNAGRLQTDVWLGGFRDKVLV
jgi:adenylate kinase family enzyme